LILIGAGVWIWRRSVAEEGIDDEAEDSGLTDLLAEVIELEKALADEQVEPEQYLNDRSALNQLIRVEIGRWEAQHSASGNSSDELNPPIDPVQGD
jgi:hypothetical protein